jgi:hypothetical protein
MGKTLDLVTFSVKSFKKPLFFGVFLAKEGAFYRKLSRPSNGRV